MWIEIFKTGTHTDSRGRTKTFTEEDLDRTMALYDSKQHESPVVIGHPKDNAPAWGWAAELRRMGNTLQAKLHDIAPEFREWVKQGRFKKRSASFYPDGSLRHIGFLGAQPPAVKGLPDVAFSEQDFSEYEFAEHRMIAGILQRLREWIIEKFGSEDADKVLPNWELDELGKMDDTPETPDTQAYSDNLNKKEDKIMPGTYTEEEMQEKLKKKEQEFSEKEAALEARARKAEDALAVRDSELKEQRNKARREQIQAFCEGLKKEGKLTPAEEKLGILEFMEALEDQEAGEFFFSEGKETSLSQWFQDFLSNRGKVIEFDEVAGDGKDVPSGDEAKRDKVISDFMEKDGCDYKTAMLSESKKHPELFS